MSEPVKSSEIRTNIAQKVREVWQTGEPLEIRLDGKIVAILTMNEPSGVPPLRIGLKEAREGWSELLAEVSQSRARFYFYIRFRGLKEGQLVPKVYLVPSKYRNRFHAYWVAHRQEYRDSQVQTLTVEEQIDEMKGTVEERLNQIEINLMEGLTSAVETIKQTFGIGFAGLTRPNGDLRATPELGVVPLRSVRDLPPDVDNSR